jgi:2-haloacid dehalogenase
MYTNILFDADDTLLDFQKSQLYSFRKVLSSYLIPFTEQIYNDYLTINHQLWSELENGNISKDEVQSKRFTNLFHTINREINGFEANNLYQNELEKQSWLIPYAEEVCKELAEKYVLTIITNGVEKTQKTRIGASKIFPYITHIVVSEEIGVAKPDKRFFDYVIKLTQSKIENMLIIGDSLSSDIKGAKNAGIDSVWFNPHRKEIDKQLNVKKIISDLRELPVFIAGKGLNI